MTEIRNRILDAAARTYAEAGYTGATTRRIAHEAGINEVTLFRRFGSKDALLHEAIRERNRQYVPPLPHDVDHPARTIFDWALQILNGYYEHRTLIRRIIGEAGERPEIGEQVCDDTTNEHAQLAAYLEVLQRKGLARRDIEPNAAAAMLIGALLMNALWRDIVPDIPGPEESLQMFVDIWLAGVGIAPLERPAKPPRATRTKRGRK